MDTSKTKVFKVINFTITLYHVLSILIQFLLVAFSVGALWVVNILMPVAILLFIGNLVFGFIIAFQVTFKSKKEYVSDLVWIIINQFIIIFSFLVIFATGMTVVNF